MADVETVRQALLEKMADPSLSVAEFLWLRYKLEQLPSE